MMLTDKHLSFHEISHMYPNEYVGVTDAIELPNSNGALTYYGVIVCIGSTAKEVYSKLKGLNNISVLAGYNLLNVERIGLSVITA